MLLPGFWLPSADTIRHSSRNGPGGATGIGTNGVVPRFPVRRCGETLVVLLLEGLLNSELQEYGYARLRTGEPLLYRVV